ncbi:MAG: 3'-5' exonuclease [Oscillospiraceae bacterium]|nr:3'-5' exonuclease [Oscillospiraceae bacterium]
MDTYVAFDVETPNSKNDRMSAIGVVVVENGEQTTSFYSLVDPEEAFDSFNIRLTGITPRMVQNQPSFPVLWELLRPLLDKGVLCAHNAPFDLGVLGKCLRAYGIEWKPTVKYVCTYQMGRKFLPAAPNHRLNTLAELMDLPLQHHNALSDTKACAGLLQYYLGQADLTQYYRTYHFLK